jgi:hypothetical protein
MVEGETLVGLLDQYTEVAARTDGLVATLPDLDTIHALPAAPWLPPDERGIVRGLFLHVITEIAQHAGHADILRESIDGQKSMG